MKDSMIRLFSAFGLCIVLTACNNTVNSENLKTSGITADIIIDGISSQTSVTAFLSTGGGLAADLVNLNGGDYLSASDGTSSQVMSLASDGKYITSFPDNTSKIYTVSLIRSSDANAIHSGVIIPAPLTINSPADNQTFVSNTPIPLTWSPATGSGTLKTRHTVDCIDSNGVPLHSASSNFAINNTGSTTITLAMPTPAPGTTLVSCSALITLKLSVDGTNPAFGVFDPAYGSGSIVGTQTRIVTISVTP